MCVGSMVVKDKIGMDRYRTLWRNAMLRAHQMRLMRYWLRSIFLYGRLRQTWKSPFPHAAAAHPLPRSPQSLTRLRFAINHPPLPSYTQPTASYNSNVLQAVQHDYRTTNSSS